MRHWIRQRLPTEDTLKAHPSLRWMGPLLRRPWLWQMNRRRVALGAGIGVFFGFIVPIAQIAGAALFAIVLRANLPVAAVATLISNPLTYAPIAVLAHATGADASVVDPGWIERIQAVGKPLLLGLAVFAVVGGISAWALVHAAWMLAAWLKLRRRTRRAGRVP